MRTLTHSENIQLDKMSTEYYNQYKTMLKYKMIIYVSTFLFVVTILFSLNASAQVAGSDELPSTVVSFTARAAGDKVYVNWLSRNEPQDGFYVIERSYNNKNYKMVGIKEGIGTALSALLSYSFIDDKPVHGTAGYYRLKQISMDGTVLSVSSAIYVPVPKNENLDVNADTKEVSLAK